MCKVVERVERAWIALAEYIDASLVRLERQWQRTLGITGLTQNRSEIVYR